jgi:aminopeptidase YwaD
MNPTYGPACPDFVYDLRVKSLIPLFLTAALAIGTVGDASTYDPRRDKSGISEASVRAHMEFLASDALNGRGSGTRDEWITATYIASHLRRWGLEPLGDEVSPGQRGYVQDVRIERSEIAAPPVLSFQGHRVTHGKEVTVSLVAGPRIAGPLQKFSPGIPVTAGAVLLLPEANPPAAAETVRAAMVLSLESEQARTRRTSGAATGRPLAMQRIVGAPGRAAVALDKDTYAAVAALADGVEVALDTDAKPAQTIHTWNAVARITGSSRDLSSEAIVLSAHLDHLGNRAAPANAAAAADPIYNGADDDASGTVAVLELAHAMAAKGRMDRTVIFAWFGSEEAGGIGSRYFIETSPVPLERIVANLQFEMMGRPDAKVPPHTLWLTGYERSNLGAELAKRGAKIVGDPHPEQNFFTRSDNIQFARRGVVAHTVSSFGLHTDYHRPSDELQTIDFPHMTDAIRSMVKPILWLANSHFRPRWNDGMKP